MLLYIMAPSILLNRIIAMGQDGFQCLPERTASDDILSRQLRMYKWRADPKFNSCIARTAFKNAHILQQQQQFARFIHTQHNNQHLQIHKFSQNQPHRTTGEEQEVITFQKYQCTLIELPTTLTLEETIYALYSLLVGFQQIRSAIGKIIVAPDCCFVTEEGQVRAWINPNYKINQLYLSYSRQNLPESRPIAIIKRIINICQKISQKSQKSQHFFQFLKAALTNLNQKDNNFAQVRKFINEYCFNRNLRIANNIIRVFESQSRPASSKSIKNSWIRQQRKTEPCNETQDTNIYRSIIESQPKQLHHQYHSQNKSASNYESFEKEQGPRQQSLMETQNKRSRPDIASSVLPFASQIITRPERPRKQTHAHIQWRKENSKKDIGQAPQNSNINQPVLNKGKDHQIIISILPQNVPSVQRQSVESHRIDKQPKNLSIQESMIDIPIWSGKLSSKKISRPSNGQQNERKPRPSIPGLCKSDLNCKTALGKDAIKPNSDVHFRSWINSRTITNLIVEDEDEEQFVHSIADSSDCYNGSVYSGVLLQLGRDLLPNEYTHHKTTNFCKQTHPK